MKERTSALKVLEIGRILPRGQVTLPKVVRQAAGLSAGDTVAFEVLGDGRVEIRVLSRLSLEETLSRFHVDGPYDDAKERGVWQTAAARDVIR